MRRLLLQAVILFLCLLIPAAPALSENTAAESPRDQFINGIIATAKSEYDETDGHARRAHYAGDRYICKNFTVYLFQQNRDAYAMEAFPETRLVIPDNKTRDECKPFANGIEWKDIPAEEGNPFYEAARFRYDSSLSKAENRANAHAFMQNVQKGDYFQMTADYYYGNGPHSLVFIADYDPDTDSVHWTDSNMKGVRRDGGIRYGYVQFDAVKDIDWFVDAFCLKNHGATLYRLRDDIILRED